ncbi:MAG: glycosyltransferase family 2 protein [Candidatus Aenigmatarchaeota archaeon]
MIKISACLVVHNEEKLIKRCLDSIKNVVDEIILVHDGSCSDNTLNIARKYTNKIFVRPYIGIAEPHRVFTYKKAKGEWILKIDADEFLSKQAQKKIRKLIQSEDIDGYFFVWRLWDGKKYLTKNWPHKLCLFRKNKMSFFGFPQYTETVEGKTKKIDLELEHKPLYNNYTFYTFKKKWLRWASIQAEYTLKDFKKIPAFGKNPKVKFMTILKRKFPLFVIFFVFPLSFLKQFFLDSFWRAGYVGFKISLIHGLYQFFVCFYILKLKMIKK